MKDKSLYHHCLLRRFRMSCRELVMVFALYFLCSTAAWANPYGAQVVNGNVSIQTQGNTLNITNSPNSIINWQGFSINSNEITRFIQQSSTSAVLNRVVGQDPSAILGLLQSNGRVFLINPNGILFGQGARVEVNGLVASTLNLKDSDFLSGKYNYTAGLVSGAIKNQGTITTPNGGQVYLIAPDVENTGIIQAPGGDVLLAAGHSVSLVDSADPDISVVVSAPENRAINLGQIVALSGKIGIYGGLIQHAGMISADSAVIGEGGRIFFRATKGITLDQGSMVTASGTQGGKITIKSETDTTMVSGSISATGSEDKGGEVHILGKQVGLIDNAAVDSSGKTGGGTVLIGGDYHGENPDVQNAEAVYGGKDVTVKADATDTGDGGKVIVWSDEATRFYGAISAKGGLVFGNGGFIETSGAYLDVNGIRVNATATKGRGGTWLLDPYNIEIGNTTSNASSSGSNPILWTADTSPSTINAATIKNALDSGSNVVVDTTSGIGVEDGNITVSTEMTGMSNAGASSLTLKADNNITINAAITGNLQGLTLLANQDSSGGGDVIINQPVAAYVLSATGNNISVAGTGTITSNDISFTANTGAVSVDNAVTLSPSKLTITAATGIFGSATTDPLKTEYADVLPLELNVHNTGLGPIRIADSSPCGIKIAGAKQDSSGTPIFISSSSIYFKDSNSDITTYGGAVNLTSSGNITFISGADIMTDGGNVSLETTGDGYNVSHVSGASISTLGGAVTIKSDNMSLGGTIDADFGKVTLKPTTAGTYIDAGGADAADTLGLTTSELNTVTAGTLVIGDVSAGDLTVTAALSKTSGGALEKIGNGTTTGALSLISGGTIAQSSGATIDALPVGLQASGTSVVLTENNPIGLIAGSASSGDFAFTSANQVTVTSVDVKCGITAGSGTVYLNSASGIDQTSCAVITSNKIDLTSSDNAILTENNAVSYIRTINATGQTFSFKNTCALAQTGVITAGTLSLTNTSGSTDLSTQNNVIGNLGAIDASGQTFSLKNTAGLSQTGVVKATTLNLNNTSGAVDLSSQDNIIPNLGTIAAPDGFSVKTTGSTLVGGITTTNTGISINVGTGTYGQTAAADVASGSGNITVVADSFILAGNTDNNAFQTTGELNIKPATAGRNITLGAGDEGSTLQLSTNELGDMVAGTLRIGDVNSGSIDVGAAIAPANAGVLSLKTGGNVTQSSSGTISADKLTIEALGNVTLDTASNSVNNLAAKIGNETNTNKNLIFKNATDLNVGSNIDGISGISIQMDNSVYDPGAQNAVIALKTLDGAITQSAGALLAGKAVVAQGDDGVTLTQANPTGVIAGNSASGSYAYSSVNSIAVTTVGGIDGITAAGDIDLTSGADIIVDNTISWSNSRITLFANNNIAINQELFGSGSAQLALYYGQGAVESGNTSAYAINKTVDLPAGNNFFTKFGNDGSLVEYSVITGVTDLQGMTSSGNYALGADIDASATSGWNSGAGFAPIASFTGTFDGLQHKISNLYINRPSEDNVGLFGSNGGMDTIRNIGLVNADITGRYYVGGVAGFNSGIIVSSSCNGSINGTDYVGGLVGFNDGGVSYSYSKGSVTGTNYVGGLVGNNYSGEVSNSNSFANVSGTDKVGGLVGYQYLGSIVKSYSAGSVSGSNYVGGLLGSNYEGGVSNSFWDKDTSGQQSSSGGSGKTTAEMKTALTYTNAGWDKPWIISDGSYACLPGQDCSGTTQTYILLFTADNKIKTYGDANNFTSNITAPNGYAPGDSSSSISYTGSPAYSLASENAGYWMITVSQGTLASQKYNFSFASGYMTINKALLTITAPSVTKIYDGTTLAEGTPTVSGLKFSDSVSGFTLAYQDRNAGIDKTVTVTGYTVNDGNAGGNYNVTVAGNNTSVITAKELTVTGITANNKIYDGTTTATLNSGSTTLDGVVSGDDLNIDAVLTSGKFDNKNVGTGKTVTISNLVLTGADKDNYKLSDTGATTTADITPKELTVTGITANNKVYDGTTAATLNTGSAALSGVIESDVVSVSSESAAGVFDNKNVGTGKTVTINNLVLTGADKDNYNLSDTGATTTADITPKSITVTGITATSKVYDGTTTATVNAGGATFDGVISGDEVNIDVASMSGVFESKHVGASKTVKLDGLVGKSGEDAANYVFDPNYTTTADITPASLTINAAADTKTYDGTTSSSVIPVITAGSVMSGDTISLSQVYTDKHAGTGKTLIPSATINDGNGGNNYMVTPVNENTGVINKASLTIMATYYEKTYDGTTYAGTPLYSGLQAGDTVTGIAQYFYDKNAGLNKTIQISGSYVVNDGNSGNNYTVNTGATQTTGTIYKAPLSIIADDKTRVYGDDNPSLTVTFIGFVGGETLATSGVTGSAGLSTSATKSSNVGNYVITADAGTLSADNYSFNRFTNGSLRINKAPLSIIADDKFKFYGEENPELTATYVGLKLGQSKEVLEGSLSLATDATKDSAVGAYKITPSGQSSDNYEIAFVDGTLTVKPEEVVQQNSVLIVATNKSGETTETTITTGGDKGQGGDNDEGDDKDKDKDKDKGDSSSKDGKGSETNKQPLPYCN